jgi:hypothetical protein
VRAAVTRWLDPSAPVAPAAPRAARTTAVPDDED